MTDIFVSYKREDEKRVLKLVRALEACGHKVWWDRGLPGGESWQANIENALANAKCVIAVWTRNSIGPEGGFVRDEARDGLARGILVPVFMDRVKPPLGFGEVQSIDLIHWRGSKSDPFFKDLLASVDAKLSGKSVPPAKGPMIRMIRRLTYGSIGTVATACAIGFGLDLYGVQARVCTAPVAQSALSDMCGSFGFGDRPTYAERIAWENRRPGNCDDLRSHVARFENGAYRAKAAELIAARQIAKRETWTPDEQSLRLFEPAGGSPLPDERAAQADALSRAQSRADTLCNGLEASRLYRLVSAQPKAEEWTCDTINGGVVCGFSGQAVCTVEARSVIETETCGGTG